MRIYDPRIAKFLSVDPLTKSFPWYTPYQFAGNMPTIAIDLDGAEPLISTSTIGKMKDPMQAVKGAAEITIDNTKRFLSSMGNTFLGVVGGALQPFDAGHYGNKVSKDRWAQTFPMLPNNNIAKDLVVPAVMAPVDVVNRIRNNPFDAEAWGEAAAIIGVVILKPGAKGRAPDIALGLNDPVPAGPPRSLYRFAEQTNSYMHNQWLEPFGSLAEPKPSMASFGDIFTQVMDNVTSNGGTVKFDITNLKMDWVVSDIGKSALDASTTTNFEFNSIMSNSKYFKSTKFYENGTVVNRKTVRERYQKAIEQSKSK